MFRTIRMQFLESFEHTEIHSLEEYAKFLTYAENSYNLRTHSSLGESPMERYLRDKQRFKFVASPSVLDKVFLREVNRKVNKLRKGFTGILLKMKTKTLSGGMNLKIEQTQKNEIEIILQKKIGSREITNDR